MNDSGYATILTCMYMCHFLNFSHGLPDNVRRPDGNKESHGNSKNLILQNY